MKLNLMLVKLKFLCNCNNNLLNIMDILYAWINKYEINRDNFVQ